MGCIAMHLCSADAHAVAPQLHQRRGRAHCRPGQRARPRGRSSGADTPLRCTDLTQLVVRCGGGSRSGCGG
eukprot:2166090-Rhodomonas_salina.1